MITHEEFVNFNGGGEHAFGIALQTLLPLGFQVEAQGSSHLIVSSKGFRSTRQHPLQGITRAEFNASRSALTVKAELGGVDWLARFILILVLGMAAFDTLLFTGLWYFLDELHQSTWMLAIPLASFLPWIFLAPYMIRMFKKRTVDALKTLLDNMAM